MKMPKEWTDTLGVGAKVFVLDSGFRKPSPFVVKEARNFSTLNMQSLSEHGHHMCEIIAGQDPLNIGHAPYCDLYVAKVWDAKPAVWDRYEAALDWAIHEKADVVSMSFAMLNISQGMLDRFKILEQQGAICCAAYSGFGWPHGCPEVIACGRIGRNQGKGDVNVGDIIIPSPQGRFTARSGTSVATACVAGIAACAKAFEPSMTRLAFLVHLATF